MLNLEAQAIGDQVEYVSTIDADLEVMIDAAFDPSEELVTFDVQPQFSPDDISAEWKVVVGNATERTVQDAARVARSELHDLRRRIKRVQAFSVMARGLAGLMASEPTITRNTTVAQLLALLGS